MKFEISPATQASGRCCSISARASALRSLTLITGGSAAVGPISIARDSIGVRR